MSNKQGMRKIIKALQTSLDGCQKLDNNQAADTSYKSSHVVRFDPLNVDGVDLGRCPEEFAAKAHPSTRNLRHKTLDQKTC